MSLGLATILLAAAWAQGPQHRPGSEVLEPLDPDTPVIPLAIPSAPGMPEVHGDCPDAMNFGGTELEKAAWCAAQQQQFVSSRNLADRALRENEGSFRAQFLMGYVQHLSEGNLPKALYHLQRAEQLFIQSYGERPSLTDSPWRVYHRILHQIVHLLGEMDAHEEKIRYVDALSRRLDLDYRPLKAWPLLKLKRFEEARQIAEEAIVSEDAWYQAVGLTALCAVESEQRHRIEAYESCKAAAERVMGASRDGSIELSNAGAAAEEMFKFDEAERLYQEAAKRDAEGSVNPYGRLVRLYLRQGRFSESVGAWREMRVYRASRPGSYLDQQDQAEADLIGASVLLIAGKSSDAERITARTVKRPDRQGTSSAASEQNEAGAQIMDRVAKLDAARQLEEQAVASTFKESLPLRYKALQLRFEAWRMGRKAAAVLADRERLVSSLRPECPGSIELPSWLDGEVVELVGAGATLSAIEQGKQEETLPSELSAPIFLGLQAEAHLLAGDNEAAKRTGQQALDGLSPSDALMRARAAMIVAEASRRETLVEEALAAYRIVLGIDPGIIRRMGFRLPVSIQATGEGPAAGAAQMLSDSPLFAEEPWGFVLRVGDEEVALLAEDGSLLQALHIRPGRADDPEARARLIARTVQQELLVPSVDITQADIRSLDGSLGTGAKASEQVKGILDEIKQGDQLKEDQQIKDGK